MLYDDTTYAILYYTIAYNLVLFEEARGPRRRQGAVLRPAGARVAQPAGALGDPLLGDQGQIKR